MNESDLVAKMGITAVYLSGAINANESPEFIEQFRRICSLAEAKTLRSIVYIWYTERVIPRMKGGSNVIYIGKTNTSFYTRHYRYAEVEGSNLNWERYKHIIKSFGPIRFLIAAVTDPRQTEKKLLSLYFQEHLELPPVNAVG